MALFPVKRIGPPALMALAGYLYRRHYNTQYFPWLSSVFWVFWWVGLVFRAVK
jgi:hypothetical protein